MYTCFYTTWQSAAESIKCAELARVWYKAIFSLPCSHTYIISWAIRMNLPTVLKKLYTNGWFVGIDADMLVTQGQVEGLMWMGLQGFCDFSSPKYDEYLTVYFDARNGRIRMDAIVRYYCQHNYSFPTLKKDPVIKKGF
jgi:hypothetical protein